MIQCIRSSYCRNNVYVFHGSLSEETMTDFLLFQNDYALRKLYAFVNMCESRVPVETMEAAIDKTC